MIQKIKKLSTQEIDRVIEMAWEDRTPFEAIKFQFDLSEQEVIALMKQEMRLNNWKKWRKRVQGRTTKHLKKRNFVSGSFKCTRQKNISGNRIT